ncbi:Uncharacterised protein [Mycobacteroides abscessus subsp. abscessus]|nr:Uncharacterised protein [Mycobacteroides abscessus subsp. abscessus]
MLTGDHPIAGVRRERGQRRQGAADADQPLGHRRCTSQCDQQFPWGAALRCGYPAAVQHPDRHCGQVIDHIPQPHQTPHHFEGITPSDVIGDDHVTQLVEKGVESRCVSHNTWYRTNVRTTRVNLATVHDVSGHRCRRRWPVFGGNPSARAPAAVCYRADKHSGSPPLGNVTGDAPRCSAFALINRSPQVEPAMPKSRLFHDMTALLTRSHRP